MIPKIFITEWRQQVPWIEDFQVEQDLIISRALVNLYENQKIQNAVAFRGGTALHKLYVSPAARYSEDIDLVQIHREPIGETIDAIRLGLQWLGEPIRKITARGVKLIYRYLAEDSVQRKLKIEINTTEHFHILDLVEHNFSVKSSWFSGESMLRTYNINELLGTKLRALYQRKKGRDLFDLWTVLKNGMIDCESVTNIFSAYCKQSDQIVTRAIFEKNLIEKIKHPDFQHDALSLIVNENEWPFELACKRVHKEIISLLPGEPWKGPEKN